jgi:RND family efflux transporter MFP subunit
MTKEQDVGLEMWCRRRLAGMIILVGGTLVQGNAIAEEFDCIIAPRQILELRSPLEGLIESIEVSRGDLVVKGQVLAVLNTEVDQVAASMAKYRSEMEGEIDAARSRVEYTQKKSKRMLELHGNNYVSEELHDEAAAEKKLAEAELQNALDNRALAKLEYQRQMEIIRLKTTVSPINGVVLERILNPGELAEAGVGRKPMLKLAEIEVLRVEALLPVQFYAFVERGMQVDVIPEIPVGTRYSATVDVIDRVIETASGTFLVRMQLPNPDHVIPAGIRCKAIFPQVQPIEAR